MAYEDKTLNNIIIDLKNAVESDVSTEEGTLVDHAFRGRRQSLNRHTSRFIWRSKTDMQRRQTGST